ncbi:TolC family protein [Pannonibacter phragmitetus]|uniref:TolC family protein n=1 Tax=Pannonibacter phragmitetus TaxID=121719 RepID=UPI003D2F26C5
MIATYEQAVLSSLSDVEKALVALNTSGEELAIAGKAVAAARRAYELTQEQLEAGQVDMTTVLNTQREYFSAADSLEQLRLARFQAAIALYRALGGGWSPEDARLLMQPKEMPSTSGTKTVAAASAAVAQ